MNNEQGTMNSEKLEVRSVVVSNHRVIFLAYLDFISHFSLLTSHLYYGANLHFDCKKTEKIKNY